MYQPQDIHAALEFLQATTQRPFNYLYPAPEGQPQQNASYHPVTVPVSDARARVRPATLQREGYTLVDAPSTVADFLDREAVRQRYYPEAAELARAASGASQAIVFDHLIRERAPGTPQAFGRIEGQRPSAAGRVHCDFTAASAHRRLTLELGPQSVAPERRYAIVNLWRSIRHPVLDAPLALCDARSLARQDLVASDIYYPDRIGEIYQVLHNTAQQWAYFPAMTRDEVLLFMQFDSAAGATGGATAHAAFEHPDIPPGTPLRASIEVRCLLIFGD